MKEIKAYVRPERLSSIVSRLEQEGARDLTVTRVDAIGALADTEKDRLRFFRNYHSIRFTRDEGLRTQMSAQ